MGGLIQRWRGGEDGDTPQRRTLYVFGAVVVFGLIGLAVVAISDLVGGDDDATGTSVQTEQANEDGGGDAATPAADGDAGTEQAVNDAVEEATAAADDAVDEGTDAPPPTTLTPTDLPPPNIRSLFRQAVPSIDPTGGGTYDAVSFVKLNDPPADLDLEVRFVRNGDTCYVGVDLFDKVPDSMELDTFLPSGVQIPGHDYGVKGKPQPAYFENTIEWQGGVESSFIFSTDCTQTQQGMSMMFSAYGGFLAGTGDEYDAINWVDFFIEIPVAPPALADELERLDSDIIDGVVSVPNPTN